MEVFFWPETADYGVETASIQCPDSSPLARHHSQKALQLQSLFYLRLLGCVLLTPCFRYSLVLVVQPSRQEGETTSALSLFSATRASRSNCVFDMARSAC